MFLFYIDSMKKVALLYNYNRWMFNYEADFDCDLTIESLKNAISKNYECMLIEADQNIPDWISKIKEYNPDIVFNITESYNWVGREAFCPILLEQIWFDYTGPGPVELINSHNKIFTKKMVNLYDILTPNWFIVKNPEHFEHILLKDIRFPLIVKLNSEGSSMWMDENCIVKDEKWLKDQIYNLAKNFHSEILVEEYIEWIDISMTYIEWLWIFWPVQYVYPGSTIYDFRLKTVDNDQVIVKIADNITDKTNNELFQISQKIISLLDIHWYWRIDYRISPSGEIFFLELNAQVSFHPDWAFVWWGKSKWLDFDYLVKHIIDYSLSHKRMVSLYWTHVL